MNRRGAGVGLISLAAFLYAARMISAAIYMAGTESKSAELFRSGLKYVGNSLTVLAVIALIVGTCFLAAEEIMAVRGKEKERKGKQDKETLVS